MNLLVSEFLVLFSYEVFVRAHICMEKTAFPYSLNVSETGNLIPADRAEIKIPKPELNKGNRSMS